MEGEEIVKMETVAINKYGSRLVAYKMYLYRRNEIQKNVKISKS